MDEDIFRLKTTTIGLLNDLDCNGSTLSEDLINEMSRYGASELHAIAAFVGGVASQKVIKVYIVKVLEDGDLQTLGMLDYDKRLQHSFTAHSKVDPVTGEMFTFGYSQTPPYATYRVISKDGVMQDPFSITIPTFVMMHDFAIIENYAIMMDLPLYFRPKEMVKNKQLAYNFDPTKKARFGVLPRYAKNESLIKWFELPNCFIFHNANAWKEGYDVVLITCLLQNLDLDAINGTEKVQQHDGFTNDL
ncbi:Carotenoid 9,10(9',10')-cleavage dioxygenase 1, partial [Capsicum baccatum]